MILPSLQFAQSEPLADVCSDSLIIGVVLGIILEYTQELSVELRSEALSGDAPLWNLQSSLGAQEVTLEDGRRRGKYAIEMRLMDCC